MTPDELNLLEFLVRYTLADVYPRGPVYVTIGERDAAPELLSRLADLGHEMRPGRRPNGADGIQVSVSAEGDTNGSLVECNCDWYLGPVSARFQQITARRTPDGWECSKVRRHIIV